MSIRTVVAGLVFLGVSVGCGQSPEQVLEGTRELSVAVCDPSGGPFSLDIDNPRTRNGGVWAESLVVVDEWIGEILTKVEELGTP